MDNGAAIKRGAKNWSCDWFLEITALEIDSPPLYAVEKAITGWTWGFLRQVPRLCFTHVETCREFIVGRSLSRGSVSNNCNLELFFVELLLLFPGSRISLLDPRFSSNSSFLFKLSEINRGENCCGRRDCYIYEYRGWLILNWISKKEIQFLLWMNFSKKCEKNAKRKRKKYPFFL